MCCGRHCSGRPCLVNVMRRHKLARGIMCFGLPCHAQARSPTRPNQAHQVERVVSCPGPASVTDYVNSSHGSWTSCQPSGETWHEYTHTHTWCMAHKDTHTHTQGYTHTRTHKKFACQSRSVVIACPSPVSCVGLGTDLCVCVCVPRTYCRSGLEQCEQRLRVNIMAVESERSAPTPRSANKQTTPKAAAGAAGPDAAAFAARPLVARSPPPAMAALSSHGP